MDFWVHFKFHNLIKIRPCVPLSRPKQGYTHSAVSQTTVFSTLVFETVTIFTALTSFTITRTNYPLIHLLVFGPLVINTACSSTPCCLHSFFFSECHLLYPLSLLLLTLVSAHRERREARVKQWKTSRLLWLGVIVVKQLHVLLTSAIMKLARSLSKTFENKHMLIYLMYICNWARSLKESQLNFWIRWFKIKLSFLF